MKKAMKFDNQIEEARKDKNMSQEELASKVNVSVQTIKSIENGKYRPSMALSFAIASLLNKEVADIFSSVE